MRWPRSLRARLIALFLIISGAAILGTALLMSRLVAQIVWAPLDAELAEEAETLCTLVTSGHLEGLQATVVGIATERQHGPGKFVRVLRADGGVIAEAGSIPKALRNDPPRGEKVVTDLRHRDKPMRVVHYPIHEGCAGVVGVDVRRQLQTLATARIAISISASMLLIALGGVAWLVTARATAEMDRLATEISTIEAGSLGRRLVPRRRTDAIAIDEDYATAFAMGSITRK